MWLGRSRSVSKDDEYIASSDDRPLSEEILVTVSTVLMIKIKLLRISYLYCG